MKKYNVNRVAAEGLTVVTRPEFKAICDKIIADSKAIGVKCNYRSRIFVPAVIARLSGIEASFLIVTDKKKYISKKTITLLKGRLALEYNTTIW